MFRKIKKKTIALLCIIFGQGLMAVSLATEEWKLVWAFVGLVFILWAVRVIRKDQKNSNPVFMDIPKGVPIAFLMISVLLGILGIIRFLR